MGAHADVFAKLAAKEVHVTASRAVSAGAGRRGIILWAKPTDFDRAGRALGI